MGTAPGSLDRADWGAVSGWAWDGAEEPTALEVLDNGVVVGRVLADRHRPDLETAGLREGRCAFALRFAPGLCALQRHEIRVRRVADGAELRGSPVVLERRSGFDPALQQTLLGSVQAAGATDETDAGPDTLGFLLRQVDRLAQARAALGGAAPSADHRRFYERWGEVLQRPAAPAHVPAARRILVLGERMPRPDRDSASRALLSHMQCFRRLGYHVLFAAAEALERVEPYAPALQAAGIESLTAPFHASIEEVLRRHGGVLDAVYLHGITVYARYGFLARQLCPTARIIYAAPELAYRRLARQAAVQEWPEAMARSRALRTREMLAVWEADLALTHSAAEAVELARDVSDGRIRVVPWSVAPRPCPVPFRDRRGVAFVGDFAREGNRDAVAWLIDEIMPRVTRHDPSITCRLIGHDMPEALRRRAGAGVEVIGPVPQLDAALDGVRLTVAPLRIGAGIAGKVVDSLAAGLPCVATPLAAEGLALPAQLRRQLAGDAAGLAEAICRLHGDEAENAACAAAGLAVIAEGWSLAQLDRLMTGALGLVAMAPAAGPDRLPGGARNAAQMAQPTCEATGDGHSSRP
ncbi:MAG TPA: glycosyltransferase [Acetobacteraceae bacterium]|nr:glycosyltransferase [Acetobacteraceae bacterium]